MRRATKRTLFFVCAAVLGGVLRRVVRPGAAPSAPAANWAPVIGGDTWPPVPPKSTPTA